MEIEQYMKQKNKLWRGKTEHGCQKLTTASCFELKSHLLKPTDESRYLDDILDKELTYQKQLSNMIRKMAIAMRSIFLGTQSKTFEGSSRSL